MIVKFKSCSANHCDVVHVSLKRLDFNASKILFLFRLASEMVSDDVVITSLACNVLDLG